MPRCGCQDACSCLIVAGDGISVEGIGTLERPYEITSESADLVGRVEFTDDGNVDFTTTGVGTLNDPLVVFADAVLSVQDLSDVPDTDPAAGDILVWHTDHWEFEQQSGGGGGGSVPPGGLTGEVLTKLSNADGDADWEPATGGGVVVDPIDYAILRANAAQTMGSGTEVAMTFAAATSDDPLTMWDGASLVTVKRAGLYEITMNFCFAAVAAAGSRITLVRINGATYKQWYETHVSGMACFATHAITIKLNAGDTIQMRQYQSSGANLDTYGGSQTPLPAMYVTRIPEQAAGGGGVVVDRPVSAMRQHLAATSILHATVTPVPFDTEVYSEGITWDAANAAFIAPEDGYYDVAYGLCYAANATGSRIGYIQVGGVSVAAASDGGSSAAMTGAATVKALAGQQIRVMTQQTSTVSLALNGTAIYNWVSVTKVPQSFSGSAVSTYGERNYSVSRKQSAAVSVPTVTVVPIPWDTVEADDGISVAGGTFTAPVAGYYNLLGALHYSANATGYRQVRITVNGAIAAAINLFASSNANAGGVPFSKTLKLAVNDTVVVNAYQDSGATLTVSGANNSFVSMTKVPAPVINGAAASGVWGASPLDKVGSDANFGDLIYIDARGQLRAQPQALSTSVYPKTNADLPGTYPTGMTIVQMTGAQSTAGGWPEGASGSVVTFRRSGEADADAVATQWFYVTTSVTPRAYYRSGSGTGAANAWSPWVKVFSSATPFISRSKTVNQNLTAASTYYTITFEQEDLPAVGITYSNGVFTVPEDGIYALDVALLCGSTAATQMRIAIAVTDPGQALVNIGVPAWNGQGNSMLPYSRSIRMKAGATLAITAWAGATGQNITGSGTNYTTMSLVKIAP